jgi:hypothetical protein
MIVALVATSSRFCRWMSDQNHIPYRRLRCVELATCLWNSPSLALSLGGRGSLTESFLLQRSWPSLPNGAGFPNEVRQLPLLMTCGIRAPVGADGNGGMQVLSVPVCLSPLITEPNAPYKDVRFASACRYAALSLRS